jgi:hypothetical protein
MYCKIIEVCREPLGEVQFEKKMAGKQNGRGEGLYRTLGWSRDFPRVYGEPLKSIRYWRGLFQDP